MYASTFYKREEKTGDIPKEMTEQEATYYLGKKKQMLWVKMKFKMATHPGALEHPATLWWHQRHGSHLTEKKKENLNKASDAFQLYFDSDVICLILVKINCYAWQKNRCEGQPIERNEL